MHLILFNLPKRLTFMLLDQWRFPVEHPQGREEGKKMENSGSLVLSSSHTNAVKWTFFFDFTGLGPHKLHSKRR